MPGGSDTVKEYDGGAEKSVVHYGMAQAEKVIEKR